MASRDATIKINISSNKLKVTASFFPAAERGEKLFPDDVLSQLGSMSITTGIKHDIIQKMCASEKPLGSLVIAEGIQPKSGKIARIENFIKLEDYGKAVENDDGSINFYELGEVCSASVGDKLYHKIPPTIGDPGMDVLGNEIPGLAGKDLRIVTGPGTGIDKSDSDLVIATAQGKVFVKNGILQISEVHKVDGDVDFSSGNVRFKGSVVIKGSVKAGFEVNADGIVEIKGNVEDAKVTGGNDVIIHGGFAGSGEGIVKAKNDVYVKFVENQHIEADRDIIINGESYHAELHAGRSVMAKGKKGTIVGGTCESKISVNAGYLGSVACTPTIIKLGIDPKIAWKIQKNETEIEQTEESMEKLEKSVVFLYRQKIDNNGVLPPDKQALLDKLENAKKTMPHKLKVLNEEKDNLLIEQEELEKAFAIAEKGVHPKVKVYFGKQFISIDETLGPSQFKLVKGEAVRLSK